MTKKAKKSIFYRKSNLKIYLKTFFITSIILLAFLSLVTFYMMHPFMHKNNVKPSSVNDTFETYFVDMLIEKNNEFAKKYPKNYAINVRLGILYGFREDYDEAEREFKNAIEKAMNYDYMPSFQLAKFYIKVDRLQDAQQVMDKIIEKPNKKLIKYKFQIYSMLGEAYYKKSYYLLSMLKYEKALQYYKIYKIKKSSSVVENYVKSCLSLADYYIKKKNTDDAIMVLNKAYKVAPENVLVNYKLGLMNIKEHPARAYGYLTFVNKKDPQMLKYEIYYDLINKLADLKEADGKYTDAELYRKRAKYYQNFVQNNLLYDKDLFVDIVTLDTNPGIAENKYLVNLQFKIQNNSYLDIDNLTVKVIFKLDDVEIKNFVQKIYDGTSTFKVGDLTPPISINFTESYNSKNKSHKKLTVEIYAYKYPKYSVKLYSNTVNFQSSKG